MQFRKQTLLEASRDPTSFGNLALRTGVLTANSLAKALAYQHSKAQDLKIGEICVYLSYMDKDDLETLLRKQAVLRKPKPEKRAVIMAETMSAAAQTRHLSQVLDAFQRCTLKLVERYS